MREVSKDEFYKVISDGELDVHPHPKIISHELTHRTIGMSSLWKYRSGRNFGKSVTMYAPRPTATYYIEEDDS